MAFQAFSYIVLFSLHYYIICAHLFGSSDKISPPLKFLNKLSGVQKGNNYKGVNDPEKHLSYSTIPLEFSLIKYQEFYYLNVKDALNAHTLSKLQEQRRVLPDSNNLNKNPTTFHITSHYSFFSGRPKWAKRRLKYGFNRNVKNEAIVAIEEAVKQWASTTPFRFIRVGNLRDADIRISFMRGYHGDGQPFIGDDAGLAHTFAPPDGRVHFDAAQNWSSSAAKDTYDIQTVGLHELGHALGLGHSRIKEAVMYANVNPGERKGLHEDDIKGIKALYKF